MGLNDMGWIRVNIDDDNGLEEFHEGFVSKVCDLAAFVVVADNNWGQGLAGEVGPM